MRRKIVSIIILGTISFLSAVGFAQEAAYVSTDISEEALLQAFLGEKKPTGIQTRGTTEQQPSAPTSALNDICSKKPRPRLRVSIPFASNSAVIPAKDQIFITHVAKVLADEKLINCRILVEGHTDAKGSKQRNIQLSSERAESIVTALIKQGVSKERLLGIGFGSDVLFNPNDPKDGKNRRVEFQIYE